ncbi:MAG: peptidylprolyl isomerase [Anaerolineae bacterium]
MAKRTKQRQPGRPTPKEVRRRRRNVREQRTLLAGAAAVIAAIVLILGFGFYRENIAAARAPVAVVNGQAITTRKYQQMVNYQRFNVLSRLGDQIDPQVLVSFFESQLPQTVLDNVIEQVFIEQKAAEEGITVTDQEVQEAIERALGFTGDEPAPTAPTDAGVTTTLPAGSVTREEFNERYRNFLETLKTQAGVSESQYREILRGELLREKIRELIAADVPVTAPQVHARHILVETEEEAQEIRQRLLDGEDFATVAKELSTDTGTAEKGGDLGWFGLGTMVPEFEKVAFNEPIGKISEPVKSQSGYHIIEVLERDDNRALSPSELDEARQNSFSRWLDERRASSDIQRYWTPAMVPPLPPAFASSQSAPPPPPPPSQ